MTTKPKQPVIKPTNHHDLIFKYAYSSPASAMDLLKLSFSQTELNHFMLQKLESAKENFQDKRADLVFMVPFKDLMVDAKICFLMEHKSEYKIEVFYQMLSYQTSIMGEVFKATKKPCVVIPVLFYHGKKPWEWPKSFQEGFLGDILPKIPLSMRKDVLNFGSRVIDTHAQRVNLAIKDESFKTRGFLNLLKRAWDLKADEGLLSEVLSLFSNWKGDRGDLLLSVGDYLWSVVPGMNNKLWNRLEHSAVQEGIFNKGGYMDIKEHIREEARREARQEAKREWWQKGQQEGIQQGQQKLILKLLESGFDVQAICKGTGLSVDEINKLKNGSN